jgi:hypothetical protein
VYFRPDLGRGRLPAGFAAVAAARGGGSIEKAPNHPVARQPPGQL